MSPIYRIVSEKLSSENSTLYKERMGFFHPAISQFSMAAITRKELKIAQIAQINKLFQFLHLIVHKVTPPMLMNKNVNNNVVKDSCILFQNMRI